MYIGVGASKFDEMVKNGRMPQPKRIDGRKVYDLVALDQAFDRLPDDDGIQDSSWDDFDDGGYA